MSFKFSCAVTLVVAVLGIGCGGGGGGGTAGTGGGSGGASGGTSGGGSGSTGSGGTGGNITSAACYAYCMARETPKDCSPDRSVAECTEYTSGCSDFATRSAACKSAFMAYWNCIAAQADPCDLPGTCGTQGEAVGTACN